MQTPVSRSYTYKIQGSLETRKGKAKINHMEERKKEKSPHSTSSLLFPVEKHPKRSKLENHLNILSYCTTLSLSFGSKKAITSYTSPIIIIRWISAFPERKVKCQSALCSLSLWDLLTSVLFLFLTLQSPREGTDRFKK